MKNDENSKTPLEIYFSNKSLDLYKRNVHHYGDYSKGPSLKIWPFLTLNMDDYLKLMRSEQEEGFYYSESW